MGIQTKVSFLQAEPYPLLLFHLPSCAAPYLLLLFLQKHHDLPPLELHELLACFPQDPSKGQFMLLI
ncbi:hypothetical protein DPEC_G00071900 [Dallia pectoralis]|uniref:Uncharacterized protein n=1 Tax=Dallia pectoralis TaxID=75939 RepID=A0ACC2H2L6_DALPE|nr:hypothetical protein DPEC_G00071900 [Dallia pectoralis]